MNQHIKTQWKSTMVGSTQPKEAMDLRAACPNLAKCPATLSCTRWRQLAPAGTGAGVGSSYTRSLANEKRGSEWSFSFPSMGILRTSTCGKHGFLGFTPEKPDEFHHEIHDGGLGIKCDIEWNFHGNFTNDGNRMGCIAI